MVLVSQWIICYLGFLCLGSYDEYCWMWYIYHVKIVQIGCTLIFVYTAQSNLNVQFIFTQNKEWITLCNWNRMLGNWAMYEQCISLYRSTKYIIFRKIIICFYSDDNIEYLSWNNERLVVKCDHSFGFSIRLISLMRTQLAHRTHYQMKLYIPVCLFMNYKFVMECFISFMKVNSHL